MTIYLEIDVLNHVRGEPELHSFSEVSVRDNTLIPETAGIYIWYNQNVTQTLAPIYIGETSNLRERIRTHCTSYTNSPMRQALRRILRGHQFLSEDAQFSMETDWLREHAFVFWLEMENRKEVEEYLIRELKPPFNIEHNPQARR